MVMRSASVRSNGSSPTVSEMIEAASSPPGSLLVAPCKSDYHIWPAGKGRSRAKKVPRAGGPRDGWGFDHSSARGATSADELLDGHAAVGQLHRPAVLRRVDRVERDAEGVGHGGPDVARQVRLGGAGLAVVVGSPDGMASLEAA